MRRTARPAVWRCELAVGWVCGCAVVALCRGSRWCCVDRVIVQWRAVCGVVGQVRPVSRWRFAPLIHTQLHESTSTPRPTPGYISCVGSSESRIDNLCCSLALLSSLSVVCAQVVCATQSSLSAAHFFQSSRETRITHYCTPSPSSSPQIARRSLPHRFFRDSCHTSTAVRSLVFTALNGR